MALPTNFDTVTVTGAYVLLDGSPAKGTVKFTAEVDGFLADAGADVVVLPMTLSVQLDGQGAFTIELPATDDPDISPNGFTYRVQEQFSSGSRSYSIIAPVNGGAIDLVTVAPTKPVTASVALLPKSGGTLTGPTAISTRLDAEPVADLPAGYGDSDAQTGLAITSSRPSDDVVGGTDGTGRLSLYSYQRANAYSFGEVIRTFLMCKDAKAMHAWYAPQEAYDSDGNPVGDSWHPVTWTGSHWESNGHTGNHKHWEIEIPDSNGALQGRFEVLFGDQSDETIGLDKTKIMTNLADFVVRCHGTSTIDGSDIQQALRLASRAGWESAIEFANDTDGDEIRWRLRQNSAAEDGTGSGSDLQFVRYSDDGTYLGQPLILYRKTGAVVIGGTSGEDGGLSVTSDFAAQGPVGFFGATPTTRPEVTGSQADGTALASLLSALASLGLITDSTTT